MLRPAACTRPPAGSSRPVASFASVVLPLPFGPSRTTTSPRRTRMLTSSRTGIRRYRTRRGRPRRPARPGRAVASSSRSSVGTNAGRSRRNQSRASSRGASSRIRPSSTKSTRSASASARPTRCSERTTAVPRPSSASRNSSAPAGSSWEVGSSSEQQPRPQREGGGQADPLELAARQLGRPAIGQVERADRAQRTPRSPPGSRRGGVPTFSSPNATSFTTRPITTWSSGSWKTVATVPASSDGRVRRVS